ncbi:MAG TPA: hypothetical protein VGI70_01480 [Polyangiales bacterium]|jgi:hypothetical protein
MTSDEFREVFDRHVAFVGRVLRRHGVPPRDLVALPGGVIYLRVDQKLIRIDLPQ